MALLGILTGGLALLGILTTRAVALLGILTGGLALLGILTGGPWGSSGS